MAFRLLRLLNLWQRQEEQCILLYREAQSQQVRAASLVMRLEEELSSVGHQQGTVDGEGLHRFWAYRQLIGERLEYARKELSAAEQRVDRARAELIGARQRRKTLEALKDRHEARVRLEMARRDQALLDEAGLRSHQAAIGRGS